jgi:hypothetical protein
MPFGDREKRPLAIRAALAIYPQTYGCVEAQLPDRLMNE